MDCDSGRLLVVDDDQTNREMLYDLLTPRGYAVQLAEDIVASLKRHAWDGAADGRVGLSDQMIR